MANHRSNQYDEPGRIRRMSGHFKERVRLGNQAETSRHILSEGKNDALSAIRPNPLDARDALAGLRGRYKDGGRAQFAQMVRDAGLSDQDLEKLRQGHLKFRLTYGITFVLALAGGMLSVLFSGELITILGGGAFAVLSIVFAALAAKGDYSAWQIGQRRFGGFRDYIENRDLPPITSSTAVVLKKTSSAAPVKDKKSSGYKDTSG
ncbi:MAG: hypothetical protein ABJN42_13475 [Roseibium sp.]|uniref:hypothetical protein n=1 Tax=Roseibium sp. TaxID=1936156 RepID=UPI003298A174